MGLKEIETKLGFIFDNSLSAREDTIWFSKCETLYDVILSMIEDDFKSDRRKVARTNLKGENNEKNNDGDD